LSTGINYQQFDVDDPNGIGIHNGKVQSFFAQFNRSGARLNLEAGFRYEQFMVSGLPERSVPVIKLGANYLIRDQLAVRASFGQGYRFPSFSEMFVNRPDDRLSIYPNPNLRPESGWSAELGIKKEFAVGDWRLFADFALFMMDYKDMTAFVLGSFVPDSIPNPTFDDYIRYLGFRSENISRARIGGLELSVSSMGKIGQVPLRILAGYTYSYPVDLNYNDTLSNVVNYWGRLFSCIFADKESYLLRPMLKYRNRHLVKVDVESGYKNWLIGVDFRYYSRMESMDTIFIAVIPGMTDYTASRSGNEYFVNLRLAYDFGKYGQLSCIVGNLTNRFYTLRFARAEPPRNITLQYRIRI
jgi:iron complex outermembrane receptor protein